MPATARIEKALSTGRFEREVAHHEIPHVEADLILTQKSAHWDLT